MEVSFTYFGNLHAYSGGVDINKDIWNQATADVIEGARSRARLSQPQLAKASGIPPVTVQKLIAGTTGSMKVAQFVALALGCGRDPEELMREVVELAGRMSVAQGINNVTVLHPRDATPGQLEEFAGAADKFSPEATEPDEN